MLKLPVPVQPVRIVGGPTGGNFGAVGPTGMPGSAALTGLMGADGATGRIGKTGPTGLAGLAEFLMGLTGVVGPSGTDSVTGNTGAMGPSDLVPPDQLAYYENLIGGHPPVRFSGDGIGCNFVYTTKGAGYVFGMITATVDCGERPMQVGLIYSTTADPPFGYGGKEINAPGMTIPYSEVFFGHGMNPGSTFTFDLGVFNLGGMVGDNPTGGVRNIAMLLAEF